MVGADVCGKYGDVEDDLCARWYELAAYYPFSRNHNDNGTRAQEPFMFTNLWPVMQDYTYTDLMR